MTSKILNQITAELTNNGADLDLEAHLAHLRNLSESNRRRLLREMQALGVSELHGCGASIYLRCRSSSSRVDLARLQAEFPQAYAACVDVRQPRPYIIIKQHR